MTVLEKKIHKMPLEELKGLHKSISEVEWVLGFKNETEGVTNNQARNAHMTKVRVIIEPRELPYLAAKTEEEKTAAAEATAEERKGGSA